MGTYTELVLAIKIKTTDTTYIDILNFMINDKEAEIKSNHPLFSTQRWVSMLQSDSYYFDGTSHSEFFYDKIPHSWFLTVRCNLKNYDGEINKFLDWIKPVSSTFGFVGYTRHEEQESPTLIYFDENQIRYE